MPGWEGSAALKPGDEVCFHNQCVWLIASGDAGIQISGGVTYDGASWGGGSRAVLMAETDLARSVINVMRDDPVFPTVIRGFDVHANNRVTSGICLNWPQMDRDLNGAKKVIEDCIVHDVFSQGSLNQYEYGIVVGSWFGFSVRDVDIIDCTVFNISRTAIALYPGNDVPENRIENITVRGCETYNTGLDYSDPGSGFGIGLKNSVINAVVEYNVVHHNFEAGIFITTHPEPGFHGPQNAVIRHNIIRDNGTCGVVIQQRGNKRIELYGNLIFNNKYEGIRISPNLQDELDLLIYNNTLYNNYVLDWSQEMRVYSNDAVITRLEVKNNIFHASQKTRCLVDDDEDITEHSYNVYYRETGRTTVVSGDNSYWYSDVNLYEPTAMFDNPDLHNPAETPLRFTGTFGSDMKPDTEGLNLTVFSPAKDFCAGLPVAFNSSINSVARANGEGWDTGAYEFENRSGNYLALNRSEFSPGDDFLLRKRAINMEPTPVELMDFVILDVHGTFFFWPDWSPEIDFVMLNIPPVSHEDSVVLDFVWPDVSELSNLAIAAGLVDPATGALFGTYTVILFSYEPGGIAPGIKNYEISL